MTNTASAAVNPSYAISASASTTTGPSAHGPATWRPSA